MDEGRSRRPARGGVVVSWAVDELGPEPLPAGTPWRALPGTPMEELYESHLCMSRNRADRNRRGV